MVYDYILDDFILDEVPFYECAQIGAEPRHSRWPIHATQSHVQTSFKISMLQTECIRGSCSNLARFKHRRVHAVLQMLITALVNMYLMVYLSTHRIMDCLLRFARGRSKSWHALAMLNLLTQSSIPPETPGCSVFLNMHVLEV